MPDIFVGWLIVAAALIVLAIYALGAGLCRAAARPAPTPGPVGGDRDAVADAIAVVEEWRQEIEQLLVDDLRDELEQWNRGAGL